MNHFVAAPTRSYNESLESNYYLFELLNSKTCPAAVSHGYYYVLKALNDYF